MRSGNFERWEPALILLSGLPGTGKTTFARTLAEVLEFDHIESDAIRRLLVDKPTYSAAESARVFARAEAFAAAALKAGRHTLIDATNLTPGDRQRFVRVAARFGATLVAVRVTAPHSVVRARLGQPRTGFSQATEGVYEMMRERARRFSVPAIVVDTRFALQPSVELVRALATGEFSREG